MLLSAGNDKYLRCFSVQQMPTEHSSASDDFDMHCVRHFEPMRSRMAWSAAPAPGTSGSASASAKPVSSERTVLSGVGETALTEDTSFARALAVLYDNRFVVCNATNGSCALSCLRAELCVCMCSIAWQVGAANGAVQIWEHSARAKSPVRLVQSMTGHSNGVLAVAAIDRNLCASGSEDYSIRIV